jgi:histone acetyltransferase 1
MSTRSSRSSDFSNGSKTFPSSSLSGNTRARKGQTNNNFTSSDSSSSFDHPTGKRRRATSPPSTSSLYNKTRNAPAAPSSRNATPTKRSKSERKLASPYKRIPTIPIECTRCHHLFLDPARLSLHTSRKPVYCQPVSSSKLSSSLSSGDKNQEETSNDPTRFSCFNLDSQVLKNDFTVHANEILDLRMIHEEVELRHEFGTFRPVFTHQLFTDEEIIGYKKPSLTLYFTSGALYTYMKVDYEEKLPGAVDIEQIVAKKLLAGFTNDLQQFHSHVNDPFIPPGNKVLEYDVPSVETPASRDTVTFEVYHGSFDTPGLREFHERLQVFLLFFIDRSSYINDQDSVWELLLLFEKRTNKATEEVKYNAVGYMTLYKFLQYQPGDSQPAWRLRISQILILPPYQRQGHGQQLLQFVYNEAEKRKFAEVNIEDPSPVFQFLRDLFDVTAARRYGFYPKDSQELEEWDKQYGEKVRKALRITPQQARRIYEILKLNSIDLKNNKAYTAYRLEVKKRLFVENEEILGVSVANEEERKEKLQEIYRELETHYMGVIRKARLH